MSASRKRARVSHKTGRKRYTNAGQLLFRRHLSRFFTCMSNSLLSFLLLAVCLWPGRFLSRPVAVWFSLPCAHSACDSHDGPVSCLFSSCVMSQGRGRKKREAFRPACRVQFHRLHRDGPAVETRRPTWPKPATTVSCLGGIICFWPFCLFVCLCVFCPLEWNGSVRRRPNSLRRAYRNARKMAKAKQGAQKQNGASPILHSPARLPVSFHRPHWK